MGSRFCRPGASALRGTFLASLLAAVVGGCGSASPTPGPIVFAAVPDDEFGARLFVMDADGDHLRRLETEPAGSPQWSPDGSLIASSSAGADDCGLEVCDQIWITEPTGDSRRLTSSSERSEGAQWSPDGERLAYIQWGESATREIETAIYVIEVDGTNPRLVADGLGQDDSAQWTPDGERIVFWSDRHSSEEGIGGDLYIVSADGSGERRLSASADVDSYDLSADGERIVFSSDRTGNGDLYIMELETSELTQLTSSPREESSPVWSPNDKWIAFEVGISPGLAIISADGKQQTSSPQLTGPTQSIVGRQTASRSSSREGSTSYG